MSRYRTIRLRNGAVVQAGLDAAERFGGRPMRPMFGKYRAVVLGTYVTDDAENLRKIEVECDVLLAVSMSTLRRVRVMQPVHGLNDAAPWIPKPATRTLSGQDLNFNLANPRGTFNAAVTQLDDLDGDMVLVEFIEGRPELPLIVGALTHESSKRRVVRGEGWSEGDASSRGTPESSEAYLRHAGTEIRINQKGDLLVDTVGAEDDSENEDPSTGQGQVRVRLKGSERFTVEMDGEDVLEVWKDGAGVHVDIGEGATEKMVLGDALNTWLGAHTHNTGLGPTTPPNEGATLPNHLSTKHKIKE